MRDYENPPRSVQRSLESPGPFGLRSTRILFGKSPPRSPGSISKIQERISRQEAQVYYTQTHSRREIWERRYPPHPPQVTHKIATIKHYPLGVFWWVLVWATVEKLFKDIMASQELLRGYLPGNLSLGGKTRRAWGVLGYCGSGIQVVVMGILLFRNRQGIDKPWVLERWFPAGVGFFPGGYFQCWEGTRTSKEKWSNRRKVLSKT